MTNVRSVHASCRCGAVQWKAPAPDYAQSCSCGYCTRNGAAWASCDTNEFETLVLSESVSAQQFDLHSPRHYHCKRCGTPLWTWTPDPMRNHAGHSSSDYENPVLNWNVSLTAPYFSRPVVFGHEGRAA